ncbi:nuclear transport factor 2 family protein [Actinophytocola sp.]|uniref:nuclear transport factor 2 family protein n=1 Tax=Actinophytocola sp. TaxID=1872138 RepID=UPI002ED6A39A
MKLRFLLIPAVLAAVTACSSESGGSDTGGSEETSTSATALAEVDTAGRSYVDAVNAGDLDKVVGSFTEDAVVVDVGREIKGADQIRRWADNEVIGGRLDVLSVSPMENGQDLLVNFAPTGDGGFEARYRFTYEDGLIVKADLQYA